jgi:hypothetical protein
MATQYTAGLSAGNVLTAATMNQIGAAWETYTPTITSSSGSFTTITTTAARWARIQKTIFLTLDFTITTVGTGSGEVRFTVPSGLDIQAASRITGFWREVAVSGDTGIAQTFNATTFNMCKYDNTAYITQGDRFWVTCTYEAA